MENNFKYTKSLRNFVLPKKFALFMQVAPQLTGLANTDTSMINPNTKAPSLNPYGFSKQTVRSWALDTGAIKSICRLKIL